MARFWTFLLAVLGAVLVVQAYGWPDTWRSVVVLSILVMFCAIGAFVNAKGGSLISRHDSMRAIAERVRMHPRDMQLHLDALREIQTRTSLRGVQGAAQKRKAVTTGMAEVVLRVAELAWPPEVAGTDTISKESEARTAKFVAALRCRALTVLMQIVTEPSCCTQLLPIASRIIALLRGRAGAHAATRCGDELRSSDSQVASDGCRATRHVEQTEPLLSPAHMARGADVQQAGFKVLGCLCAAVDRKSGSARNDTNASIQVQEEIYQLGGLSCVLDGMRAYPNDDKVQLWGCWAIVKMVDGDSAAHSDLKLLALRGGAPGLAAAALDSFVDQSRVQEMGCLLMQTCLVGHGPSHRRRTALELSANALPSMQQAVERLAPSAEHLQMQNLCEQIMRGARETWLAC
eukprot:g1589.t1